MLVRVLILFFILLYLIFYVAGNLYVKIEKSNYQFIFWSLYFVSILTLLEIIFCIYLYVTYRSKDGELGPRGFQGEPGPKGDKGKCDQTNCKKDLIAIMIKNILNKYYEDNNMTKRVDSSELNAIYNNINVDIVDNIEQENLKNIHQKIVEFVNENQPQTIDNTFIGGLVSQTITNP